MEIERMKQPAEMYCAFKNGEIGYEEFLDWVDTLKQDAYNDGWDEGRESLYYALGMGR